MFKELPQDASTLKHGALGRRGRGAVQRRGIFPLLPAPQLINSPGIDKVYIRSRLRLAEIEYQI